MHTTTRFPHLLLALLAVVAALATSPLAHAGPAPPDVPYDISITDGSKLFLVGHATGVQIYTCNGTSWGPATPRADLVDDNGKLIATHYVGPTWQARDGSKVVGRREAGVIVENSAIPWLKLSAASTSVGADGARLAGTAWIQRINTTGGVSPDNGVCSTAGQRAEVPYTADYLFWKHRA